MPAGKPDYRLGRIISAWLVGRNGKREEHPALIISPDSEIVQPEDFDSRAGGGLVRDNLVAVLGISTKFEKFDDPYIRVPIGPQTQLTRQCAVILNWFAVLAIPDDCEFLLGDVLPKLMIQINDEYRKLLRDRLKEHKGTLAEFLGLLGRRQ
jgi:hypothetical protein